MRRFAGSVAAVVTALLLWTAGCYRPTYANCVVTCGPPFGAGCPDDLVCSNGYCTLGGSCSPAFNGSGGNTFPGGTGGTGGQAPGPADAASSGGASGTGGSDGTGGTGSGGAVPTPPSQDLDLWLDANQGLTKDERIVWADQSSKRNDAFTPGIGKFPERPILETDPDRAGLPFVHFDGSGDFLTFGGDFSRLAGLSVFAVIRAYPSPAGRAARILELTISPDELAESIELSRYGLGVEFSVNARGVTRSGIGDRVLGEQQWGLLEVIVTGDFSLDPPPGTTRFYRNGLLMGEITTLVPAIIARNFNFIGRGNSGGADPSFLGDLSELMIYSRAVDDTERATIEQVLMSKWRLPGP